MAAHLFNESGQMQEVDIPDIFDVLEGGEDENAVKFLLGFSAEEPGEHQTQYSDPNRNPAGENSSESQTTNSLDSLLTKDGKPRKRDPVDPSRCIFNCENCDKAFTTKFNLKRHINLHCNPSKEAGVPVQGPPSASMPSRKARERREAMAALGLTYESTKGRPPSKNKKNPKSLKSKGKYLKKGGVNAKSVPVTSSSHSTVVVTQPSSTQVSGITVQTVPTTATATYQVVRQTNNKKNTFQSNNNSIQHQQKSNQQKHQIEVRIAAPNQQHQQQPVVVQSNQQFSLKQLPDKSFQIIQPVQQHQHHPKQSNYQPRVVQVVQNQSSKQQQQTQLHDSSRVYPIIQQGMVQGIPVSVSFVPSSSKVIFREGVIHLPQQPLPNVQAIQSALQLRPITSTGHVMTANISSSTTTTSSLSAMPKIVSTAGQQLTVAALNEHQKSTNGVGTITASIISSSFLPSRCQNDQELSCPPDELFDSEDDEDASSVATTTEAPSPEPSPNGQNNFTIFASDAYNDGKGTNDVCKASVVKVIVTSNQPPMSEEDDADADTNASLNLPSNPQRGQLQEIPRGWLRKIITTGKTANQPKVFYYNTMGKKFSSQEEIGQYFSRLGQTVRPGLFNFEPPRLVDEDDDDDEDDQEMEDLQSFGSGLPQKQQLLA
jgi:hypothetical protein